MSIEVLLIPLAIALLAGGARIVQLNTVPSTESMTGKPIVRALTTARDPELLKKALLELGASVSHSGDVLIARIRGYEVRFSPAADGAYMAEMEGEFSEETLRGDVETLDVEYRLRVQRDVYEKVVSRAERNGLQFESEQHDADGSIVLTFVSQES